MLVAALGLFIASSPSRIDFGVTYARPGGEAMKMDIYYPASPAQAVPAVVVIHGGAWMSGNRKDMSLLCRAIAAEGMLAASVDYRLAPRYKWPSMLDDVQTAVRYLRANSARLGIDPSQIGSAGASAGGHLALLLGFRDTRDTMAEEHQRQSSRVGAVLDLFGVTDMRRDYPPAAGGLFQMVIGKPLKDAGKEVEEASPVRFVDGRSAPVFIVQGNVDRLVPPSQSRWLEKRMKEARAECEAVYVDGMGHGVAVTEQARAGMLAAYARGIGFLKKHLASNGAAQRKIAAAQR